MQNKKVKVKGNNLNIMENIYLQLRKPIHKKSIS